MRRVEKLRQVPMKNYYILALLFVGVLLLLLYFSRWYQVYNDYQVETSVIRGTLSEITNLELDHYIMENPTTVIYMCTSSDLNCRNFEKGFKNMLNKNSSLKNNIIYLNLSDIDQDAFVNSFNTTYSYKVKLHKNYPAIVLFEDGKIIGLLQEEASQDLDVEEVRSYLKLHKIGERD